MRTPRFLKRRRGMPRPAAVAVAVAPPVVLAVAVLAVAIVVLAAVALLTSARTRLLAPSCLRRDPKMSPGSLREDAPHAHILMGERVLRNLSPRIQRRHLTDALSLSTDPP